MHHSAELRGVPAVMICLRRWMPSLTTASDLARLSAGVSGRLPSSFSQRNFVLGNLFGSFVLNHHCTWSLRRFSSSKRPACLRLVRQLWLRAAYSSCAFAADVIALGHVFSCFQGMSYRFALVLLKAMDPHGRAFLLSAPWKCCPTPAADDNIHAVVITCLAAVGQFASHARGTLTNPANMLQRSPAGTARMAAWTRNVAGPDGPAAMLTNNAVTRFPSVKPGPLTSVLRWAGGGKAPVVVVALNAPHSFGQSGTGLWIYDYCVTHVISL